MNDINIMIPGIALRGVTPIPNDRLEFDLSRERSIYAAQYAMTEGRRIYVIAQKDVKVENPKLEDLEAMGVVATINRLVKLPNDNIRISISCEKRAVPVQITEYDPGLVFEVAVVAEEQEEDEKRQAAMVEVLMELVHKDLAVNSRAGRGLRELKGDRQKLNETMNIIAANVGLNQSGRQAYLELDEQGERFDFLCHVLNEEISIHKYRQEIQEKVKEGIDKNQKEYVLREQMKVIKNELGENESDDAEEMTKKLEALDASEEVKKKLTKEINRFRMMPSISQESMVLRNYIESLLELPWNYGTAENMNIAEAERILNEDHYGLEKVKERILEYLAVREQMKRAKLTREEAGDRPILCLVGPPGTGKTSIARSIARALGRKYVRICLGGIRDEAEIRGHRKTYIGAMPGRITTGIRQAGVRNPVMLLDEIDKVGSDYKGDPSAALLEVLDPEQNCAFLDHFLEVPLDLSDVLFVATANDPQTIPAPLRDRMEMIEISGYTENEKYHIATQYLIEKQIKRNGLKVSQVTFTDDAVRTMISGYTREAGVRKLEQQIAKVCRKCAKHVLEEEEARKIHVTEIAEDAMNDREVTVIITKDSLPEYLGKQRFRYEPAGQKPQIGLARGLAWTSVGGDTLEIEVCIMPGTGKLVLTGQLGDVMKESATIALSCVRMKTGDKLAADFYEKHDIHIHVPEGAVPKDGPSAGITMTTALYSAMLEIPVRADVAMTGEVTLRGRVLPIGGLKEKLLAAAKCGVKMVLVPKKNRADVEELSEEITGNLEIHYVSAIDEVLSLSLAPEV